MISDLSPGDRLSLKGKLFELQRKLNLIDLEHKLDEQYPYKPTILEYDLPNRIPANFVENSNKAEIIRKQKKKMLADSLQSQTDESCTFQPRLYTHQKSFHADNRPVHIRLGEKGKEYQDQLERRKQQYSMYDDRGRRLFTPKINHHRPGTSLNTSGMHTGDSSIMEGNPQFMSPDSNGYHEHYQTSQFPVPGPQSTNTISAEEFLYQDAKDRELRLRNLVANHEEEIRQSANGAKINPTSKKMLIQKADRHTRHVFSLIDKNGDNIVSYEDVSVAMEKYKLFSNQEQLIKSKELFWEVIDHHKDGVVERVDFQDITIPFLLQKALNAIVPAIQKKELSRLQQQQQQQQQSVAEMEMEQQVPNEPIELRASSLQFMKEKDLQEFKDILMKFIDAAERKKIHDRNKRAEARNKRESSTSLTRSRNDPTVRSGGGIVTNNDGTGGMLTGTTRESRGGIGEESSSEEQEENFEFKPKILPHSFKLAQQKVKKDLALLAGLMSSSTNINLKGLSSSASESKYIQDDQQQNQDVNGEVSDSSPPPPPPSSNFPHCEGVMLGGEFDEGQEEEGVDFDNGATASHQLSTATGLGSNAMSANVSVANSIVLASPESAVSHYDLMHARALISKQKKEQLKTTIMKRELEKCTFQPKLVTKSGASNYNNGRGRSRSYDRQSGGASVGGELGAGESMNIEELSMASVSLRPDDAIEMDEEYPHQDNATTDDQDAMDHAMTSSAFSSPQSKATSRNNFPGHHQQQQPHGHIQSHVPVHERLYALQSKKNVPSSFSAGDAAAGISTAGFHHLNSPPPSYVQELQACSFKPKIGPQPPANIKAQLVTKINGTEKTIQRMKEFHEKKQKAKEEEENAWKQLDAKYQKSRELLKNKMIPFQSNLEERRKAKKEKELERQKQHEDVNHQASPDAKAPLKDQFFVNIKVSVNKSAKIRVSRGDDPAVLAHRFGMIYALDTAAVQVLSTVLYESMVQNKFIVKPEDESLKASPSPVKEEATSPPSRPSTPSSSKHGQTSQSKPQRRSIRRSFLEQTAEALFGNPFGSRPLPVDDGIEDDSDNADGAGGGDEGEFEEDELEYDDGEGEDYSTFRSHNSQSDGSFEDGEDEEHSFGHQEEGEEEVHDIHQAGDTSDTDHSHGYKKYRLHGDDGVPRGDGKKKKSVLAELL